MSCLSSSEQIIWRKGNQYFLLALMVLKKDHWGARAPPNSPAALGGMPPRPPPKCKAPWTPLWRFAPTASTAREHEAEIVSDRQSALQFCQYAKQVLHCLLQYLLYSKPKERKAQKRWRVRRPRPLFFGGGQRPSSLLWL